MWSYYGSKSKIVNCYPPPKKDKIIEPFAGSARYSLKYFDRDVHLNDKYEVIVRIWKYLQQCSENDIMKLPELKLGQKINRNDFDCIEQAWLMGFLAQNGTSSPNLTVTLFGATSGGIKMKKKKIISQLFKIKHWKITQIDYTELENENATWFIDPPYFNGGHCYKYSNKMIDYNKLADWCKSRTGQVIVCENTKANWLPFKPMKKMRGAAKTTTEAIWSNERTAFDNVQFAFNLKYL